MRIGIGAAVMAAAVAVAACGADPAGSAAAPGMAASAGTTPDAEPADRAADAGARDDAAFAGTDTSEDRPGPDATGAPDTPPSPPEPTVVTPAPGDPPAVTSDVLLSGSVTFAAPGAGDDVVGAGPDGLFVLAPGGEPQAVTGGAGDPRAILVLPDAPVLVLTSSGLFALSEGVLQPSPLGDAVPDGAGAVALAAGDTLWMAGPAGVAFWRDGLLYSVAMEPLAELQAPALHLAFGPRVDGQPALWVGGAAGLLAVTVDGTAAWAGSERPDLAVDAVAADATGQLTVAAGGDLHVRSSDGSWTWLRLPGTVRQVAAAPGEPGVWIRTDADLWVARDGWFHRLDVPTPQWIAADAPDRLLAGDAGGLRRLWLGEIVPPAPPTWTLDVEPIYAGHCSPCHGPGKLAHPMYTREHWMAQIDAILAAVTEQRMPQAPYPKLSPATIAVLAAWKQGGLLE